MTVTVIQKPDTFLNNISSMKLVCECGWEEKVYTKDAHAVATMHIRKKHGGKGGVRLVR